MTHEDEQEALVQQIAEAAEAVGTYFLGAWAEARIGVRGGDWGVEAGREAGEQWLLPLVEAQVAPLRDEVATWHDRSEGWRRDYRRQLRRTITRERERDAAESALRRVRELADSWDKPSASGGGEYGAFYAEALLAVLDSARVGAAADTQPEGAGDACANCKGIGAVVEDGEAEDCRACDGTGTAGSNGDTAPESGEGR